jgi:hypothetical protein
MRMVLTVLAILAILMGLLWVGQGLGLIMWPSSSFMLADKVWARNGALLAIAGALVLWLARRRA